jgi:hypothetical protein
MHLPFNWILDRGSISFSPRAANATETFMVEQG